MRLLLIAGLSVCLGATAAAEARKPVNGPIHARSCPAPVMKQKPDGPPRTHKLSELPPGDVYAAVYYLDGCPRRLVEAQGKVRR